MFGTGKYADPKAFGEKLHPEEPWFAVRAQDKLAPMAVEAYALLLAVSGEHEAAAAIRGLAALIRSWQQRNPDKVKAPD